MGVHVDEAGHDREAGGVDHPAGLGSAQFPHGGDRIGANPYIGVVPGIAGSIDDSAMAYEEVEGLGATRESQGGNQQEASHSSSLFGAIISRISRLRVVAGANTVELQWASEVVSMKQRGMMFVVCLVIAGLAVSAALAAPAKEETVTLAVTGMT